MRLILSSRAIWLSFSRSPGLYLPDRMPAESICTTWARRVGGAPGPCGASGMTCSRLSILPPGLGVPWHKQRRNSPRNPSSPELAISRFGCPALSSVPGGRPDLYLCIDIGDPARARLQLLQHPARRRSINKGKGHEAPVAGTVAPHPDG